MNLTLHDFYNFFYLLCFIIFKEFVLHDSHLFHLETVSCLFLSAVFLSLESAVFFREIKIYLRVILLKALFLRLSRNRMEIFGVEQRNNVEIFVWFFSLSLSRKVDYFA
jgi:hypothetical protein